MAEKEEGIARLTTAAGEEERDSPFSLPPLGGEEGEEMEGTFIKGLGTFKNRAPSTSHCQKNLFKEHKNDRRISCSPAAKGARKVGMRKTPAAKGRSLRPPAGLSGYHNLRRRSAKCSILFGGESASYPCRYMLICRMQRTAEGRKIRSRRLFPSPDVA